MTRPTWITKWPWWAWAIAAVVGIAAVAATLVVASDDDGDTTIAGDRPTTTSTSTSEPTTTTSTTATTTTAPPTTTTAPPTTTGPRPTTTTAPPAPVPGAVVITARRGGGSGEVEVQWDAVPGATGYRVLRRIGDGQFHEVADFDLTTGASTSADDVVNIWSQGYSYKPVWNPFPGQDRSPWFQVVDYRFERDRCYQVVAYNASGDAPASNIACGSPP